MSKKIYFFSLIILSLTFFSCSETKEAGKYDNWRSRNEAFMDSLQNVYNNSADHGGLDTFVPTINPNTKIYYKNLTAADVDTVGKPRPVIPNVVSVYYRGKLFTGELIDQDYTGAEPNRDIDVPNEFGVNPITMSNPPHPIPITGFIETLQQMKVGEHWLVYLPYDMCYGKSDYNKIPGYSTLVYDIYLEAIVSAN